MEWVQGVSALAAFVATLAAFRMFMVDRRKMGASLLIIASFNAVFMIL